MKLPLRIYHLAEASNWPLIQCQGLLSASRLLCAHALIPKINQRTMWNEGWHAVLPSLL